MQRPAEPGWPWRIVPPAWVAAGAVGLGSGVGWASAGRIAAWAGALVLLWCLVLVLRAPGWVARLGGFETALRWHHRWGVVGYALLLGHAVLQGGRPDTLALALGAVALALLMLGLAAAFWRGVAWRPWRRWHGLLGLALLVGWGHAAFFHPAAAGGLVLTAGLLAWRVWAFDRGGLALPFRVEAVAHPSDAAVELTLQPLGARLDAQPGQFVLLAFESNAGYQACGEFHPFSISERGPGGRLRVAIKALGHCSARLQQVSAGVGVRVQGPFGSGLALDKGPEALWVSGGIGVTPFLAALRSGPLQHDTVLMHAHRAQDELFVDELRTWAGTQPRLHWVDVSDERPDWPALLDRVPGLPTRRIVACGPPPMVAALRAALAQRGLPGSALQVESFDFRDGAPCESSSGR